MRQNSFLLFTSLISIFTECHVVGAYSIRRSEPFAAAAPNVRRIHGNYYGGRSPSSHSSAANRSGDGVEEKSHPPGSFAVAGTRRELMERTVASALATAAAVAVRTTQPAVAAESIAVSPSSVILTAALSASLCDPTVSSWKRGSRVLHVVGTAHISSVSAKLAGRVVREVLPDAVFIELDLRRLGRAFREGQPTPGIQIAYQDERGLRVGTVASRPTGLGSLIAKIIQKGSGWMGNPVQNMYKQLEKEGFLAGEEFIVAVEEGLDTGAVIVLGDRSMDVTLQRISAALAKTDLKKLVEVDKKLTEVMKGNIPQIEEWQKSPENFGAPELREFVEAMKTKETTMALMDVFKQEVPEIHNALVAERDIYMANGLNSLDQFKTVVAVMGLGHLEGVENRLKALGWSKIVQKC